MRLLQSIMKSKKQVQADSDKSEAPVDVQLARLEELVNEIQTLSMTKVKRNGKSK